MEEQDVMQDEMDCDADDAVPLSVSEGSDEEDEQPEKVYLPTETMEEDEQLVMDDSAYVMYHQATTGAPCLSFDILQNDPSDNHEAYPQSCCIVCGTQSERAHANHIIVMKMSNMQPNEKSKKNEDEEDFEESDDEDERPEIEAALIKHTGCVNRVRVLNHGGKSLAASWSETAKVHIWDLSRPLQAVNDSHEMAAYTRNQESPAAVYTFGGHQSEGYAVDWSPTVPGQLATGDCRKDIHLWKPQEGGTWHVDQRPYVGHTASVEDIQWSPNEASVLASCSVDKSIRIWDIRSAPTKACKMTVTDAHDRDVNVIHWNRNEPFIVSGGDDGIIKIWDLRQIQKGKAIAMFKHHTAPITSVEWHPKDSSIFAAAGADDQISLWDLAVEKDQEAQKDDSEPDVPPQLLFIHQGQKDIKELHWHPQLPGVVISTAHNAMNLFKTISV